MGVPTRRPKQRTRISLEIQVWTTVWGKYAGKARQGLKKPNNGKNVGLLRAPNKIDVDESMLCAFIKFVDSGIVSKKQPEQQQPWPEMMLWMKTK